MASSRPGCSKEENETERFEISAPETDFETETDENVYDDHDDEEGSTVMMNQKKISEEVWEPVKSLTEQVAKLAKEVAKIKRGRRKRKHDNISTSEESELEPEEEVRKRKVVKDNDEVGLFEGEVELGEGLEDDTVCMLQRRYRCNMKPKKVEEIAEKYTIPSNAPFLKAPLTNPEIWKKLDTKARSKDVQMTKMQTNMVKAATAFSRIYERMPEGQEKQTMKEGLTLLAQSTRQVSYLRREKQRFSLPYELKRICDRETEIDDESLYGQNVSKKMKELQESSQKEKMYKKPFLESPKNYNPPHQRRKFKPQNQQQQQQYHQQHQKGQKAALRQQPGNIFRKKRY